MLKSLLVAAIIVAILPFAVSRVWIGVLLWSWIGYMNPHRLTYGFASTFPWAQLVALAVFIGLFFSKDRKHFPINTTVVIWFIMLAWFVLTTQFALSPDAASGYLVRVIKIQIIAFITIAVITTRQQLDMLMWVIVGSIGYFTIKGGMFTLLTGGSFRVWGPPSSFIEGNNDLAVAALMILPLMYYLSTIAPNIWLRRALIAGVLLTGISAAGSQSRGAMLAGLVMCAFLWMKSHYKFRSAMILLVVLSAIGLFMPQHYWDRMATINEKDEDGNHEPSAQGRIEMWKMSYRVANDRFLGGGFLLYYTPGIADEYLPEGHSGPRATHSIYFMVLGEHGWVGLGLFLLLFSCTWLDCGRIIRKSRGDPELAWADRMARSIQISLIAYASGGAFLSLSYFDLPYHLISMTVILQYLVCERLRSRDAKIKVKLTTDEVIPETVSQSMMPKPRGRPLVGSRTHTRVSSRTETSSVSIPETLQTQHRFLGSGMVGKKPPKA